MINKLFNLVPFVFSVPLEKLFRVEVVLNVLLDDVVQAGHLVLAVDVLAQHRDALLSGRILIVDVASVWMFFFIDKIDHGAQGHLIKLSSGHSAVEVGVGCHFDHRWRDTVDALTDLSDLVLPLLNLEGRLTTISLNYIHFFWHSFIKPLLYFQVDI